ncbi:MAG: anti-sigma F factor [Ruminococcaceae bacterium]|nr:anti-sigma F factor [Oscillospiraceae bacterium]
MDNTMKLEFLSKSANEGFARAAVAAFISQLDPTLEELADIKTAVSEAVTNAIVHGYGHSAGKITLSCTLTEEKKAVITVEDAGRGIEDISSAVQPLYTKSDDSERSGMGFTVMETFMDSMEVRSHPGAGTTIILTKQITGGSDAC